MICKEMKKIEKLVYDFIDNVSAVQEETITEYLMWQWIMLNKKVKFIKSKRLHSKKEESKTGADFEIELWIIGTKKALPFLIQAKKIIKDTNQYCSNTLNYKKGKHPKQYDALIDKAGKSKMIPLYLFYTKTKMNKSIYVSLASDVRTLAISCAIKPRTIIKRDQVLDISRNLSKLCCLSIRSKIQFLKGDDSYKNNFVTLNNLPPYIKKYLQGINDEVSSRNIAIIDMRLGEGSDEEKLTNNKYK